MSASAVGVLAASVDRLRSLVEPLAAADLRRGAYPSEWTVAQVLSHLGSGAVITAMRLEAGAAGAEVDMDEVQRVWDDWNAKSPDEQARDALAADRSLIDGLGSLSDAERSAFRTKFGPLELDFDGFVLMRLNEHALHTWDVAVTFDPAAVLAADATALVVDNLANIARFAGKADDADTRPVTVATVDPVRNFEVSLGPDSVSITRRDTTAPHDLELPAEAFVRLVYGRLDPAHTPPFEGSAGVVERLRRAFPGL